jgi:DNA repair protein RadC
MYKKRKRKISDLPKDLLPREKMQNFGADKLSEEELWAIILGSGTKGFSVLDISQKLTEIGWENLEKLSLEDISKIPGVGKVKALTIKAVLELCRRHRKENAPVIDSPKKVVELVKPKIKDKKEHLFVVSINLSQKLLGIDLVALGSLNTVNAPLRDIFQPVFQRGGYFFILVHNHPDGISKPSEEDKRFTNRVKEAATLLDLELMDHIVLGDDGYFSFYENNLL